MWGKVLLATGSGALIGYATNYIAIKMLFHPYRKVGPFHGVIPNRKESFANQLGSLAKNYSSSIAESKDMRRLRNIAYATTIGRLNWFQKALFGVAYLFSRGNLQNHAPDFSRRITDALRDITRARIMDADMRQVEKVTYQIIGKEFFMLEVYGGLLGGILGFLTAILAGLL